MSLGPILCVIKVRMLVKLAPWARTLALLLVVLASPFAGAQTSPPPGSIQTLEQLMNLPIRPEGRGLCVPADRAQADQFMRLHTELLVTSLACDDAYGVDDGELYQRYRLFNQRHAARIVDSQDGLEAAFSVGGDGVAAFNAYRTRLANAEADRLRRLSAPNYCRILSRRFDYLIDADTVALSTYITDSAGRARYRTGC